MMTQPEDQIPAVEANDNKIPTIEANDNKIPIVEANDSKIPAVDAYDGPWIEKRIEWVCDNRKQAVELFGSWNGFKGGDELDYQGQNTYSVTVKLPLGNHVYRFLIDGEDWETNHDEAKTIRDGCEYNTITVKENNEESSEDEEEETQQVTEDAPEQMLTYDESTGGFVVGKGKRKRRGRPSIEIELPSNFIESSAESPQPSQQPQQPAELEPVAEKPTTNGAHKSTKSRKKRKNKMRALGVPSNVDVQQVMKEKEEEWAKQLFVQQLRQQQQHDDEVNRVKTLWKQERQVRTEMQKRTQIRNKELEQKILELTGEVEKSKKQAEIQAGGDVKQNAVLEENLKQKDQDISSKLEEIKSLREQLTTIRKEKMELEKNTRSQAGDLETEKRALISDLNRTQAELKSLQLQNEALKKNVEEIKSGMSESKAADVQKFASLQANWEDEKKDLLKYKDEIKKLKLDLSEKEAALQKAMEAKQALEQLSEMKDKESLEHNSQAGLLSTKINQLEKEFAEHKEKSSTEINLLETSNRKATEQIEQVRKELLEKVTENQSLSEKLRQATADNDTSRNSESALKEQLQSLNAQLDKEREQMKTSLKEKDGRIDELCGQLEKSVSERDQKIGGLEAKLTEIQQTLGNKLSEFQNAQTTIEKLTHEISANVSQYEREKASYEQRIAAATAKDEKIIKQCKDIFQMFTAIQKEVSEIRRAKIEELEKTNEFFPNFKDLLTRSFSFHQNLVDGLMEKYKSELTLRRKYFNMLQDLRGNIRVFCRVRPLLPFEIKKGYGECISFPTEGALVIKDEKDQLLKFEFDQVYTPPTSQERVSVDTTEYVQSVMDGYNVSIFAYGQTGSGKTFTMNGPSDNPGVNLRALKHLFKLAEDRKPMFEYEIQVSIFEIYNEEVRDLLGDVEKGKKKEKAKKEEKPAKKEKVQHKILHLPDGSVEVTNLNWISVHTDQDVIELDDIAKSNRTAGVTDMNAHSSRSHMLLVVDVKGFNVPANIQYLGKLYLVDLAGSERVKKSGATGQALLEAQNINQSLSALGNCMQALQQKNKFVPYRDSTLTDIMTNALGGNAKTVMFINCCPTAEHAFETVSSLKFAERVGKVELGQAKQKTAATKKVVKPATQS